MLRVKHNNVCDLGNVTKSFEIMLSKVLPIVLSIKTTKMCINPNPNRNKWVYIHFGGF